MKREMAKYIDAIEFRHLRYFIAAAGHRSFRKAGAALGVQESAISCGIRDLEDRLGASLLLRHSGGVHLTIAGRRFLLLDLLTHRRHILETGNGSIRIKASSAAAAQKRGEKANPLTKP